MMKPNIEGRKEEKKAQQKVYQKCPENLGPAKDNSEDTTSYGLHETRTPKHLSPIQKDAGGEKSPLCLLPWSRSIYSYVIQSNTFFPGPSSSSKITSVQELPCLNRHIKIWAFFLGLILSLGETLPC